MRLLLIWALYLLTGLPLRAQDRIPDTPPGDSILDARAQALAVDLFHRTLRPETGLYNGSEYVDYSTTIKSGQPYFQTAGLLPGWIDYDGMRYDSLSFRLDIVRGVVVLDCPNGVYKLELHNELVKDFSIGGCRFVRIVADSSEGIRTGFYELLYAGTGLRLLERQSKNLQENVGETGIERYILHDSSFYLEKAGRYWPVNRRKAVLEAMADHQREVTVFMRKNHLRLKKTKAGDLLRIAAYYDRLTMK